MCDVDADNVRTKVDFVGLLRVECGGSPLSEDRCVLERVYKSQLSAANNFFKFTRRPARDEWDF